MRTPGERHRPHRPDRASAAAAGTRASVPRRAATALCAVVLGTVTLAGGAPGALAARPATGAPAASAAPVAAAQTAAPVPVTRTGLSGRDYAEEVFGDAWDYRNGDDIHLDANVMRVTKPSFDHSGAGLASFTVTGGGYVSPLWPGYPGSLLNGRDGAAPGNRVDTSTFGRVTIHAYAERDTSAGLVWFDCPGGGLAQSCGGGQPFTLKKGWHTYHLAPGASRYPGWPRAWSGGVTGIRLAMTSSTATRVSLDWVRVHQAAGAAVVRWRHPGGSGPAQLVWDRDDDPTNDVVGRPGWGVVASSTLASTDTDLASLPPGTYWLRSRSAAGTSASVRVELGLPAAAASVPDRYGEHELGALTGRRWDFSQASDVSSTHNATAVSVSGGRLSATNAGPVVNDPHVYVPVGTGIDPARFRRAVVRSSYDGPFDLRDVSGGGTMARLMWRRSDTGAQVHQSQDLLTYPSDDEIVVDLGRADILETDQTSSPWSGAPRITAFRWDPNEDRGPRRWYVDELQLWSEWTAYDRFGIEWSVPGARADTRVAVVVDRDRAGCDGTVVASGRAPLPGSNVTVWDTSATAPGRYWVCLRTTTGGVTTTRYAESPVLVSSATGPATVALAAPTVTPTVGGLVARWSLPSPPPGGRTVAVEARLVGLPGTVQVLHRATTATTLPTTAAARVEVRAIGTGGPGAWSPASPGVAPLTKAPAGAHVVPAEPRRVASLALQPGGSADVPLASQAGAPAGALGAVLNVTTTKVSGGGHVSVVPAGPVVGTPTSSVNAARGTDVPNLVLTALGSGGAVSVRNGGSSLTAHLDLVGWLVPPGTAGAGAFRSQAPVRRLDTRTGTGTAVGPLLGGRVVRVSADAWATNPATAVLGTMTSVGATGAASFVSAVPVGAGGRTTTSVLNTRPGGDAANLALVRLGLGDWEAYTNSGSTHLVVDVVGTVTAGDTAGPGLVMLPPTRVLDTRTGLGGNGPVTARSVVRVDVAARPGLAVPAGARGAVLNVTATGATRATYLSVVPAGTTPGSTSSLNLVAGETRAASVVVPLSADGAVDVYNDAGSGHVVVDVVGYVTGP